MKSDLLLRKCQFSKRYQGYHVLAECIRMVSVNENRLLAIMEVYEEVGKKFRITGSGVERNIRKLIDVSWEMGGKERLEDMTGAVFYKKLSSCELIEVLACYLIEHADRL